MLAFARDLQRATTFGELLGTTLAEIQRIGYEHAWLFVAEAEGSNDWRLVDVAGAKRGLALDLCPLLHVRGDAMLEEIAAATGPVVVEDARTDPRTDKAIVAQLQNRTIINVPLRLLDTSFGGLGTGTFGDEGCRPPTAAQLEHLTAMADQVAVAAGRIRFLEERRRAEEALAHREEDLRITLDSIGDGVIATDDEGRVTRMNPVAEALTGWSIADARGKSLDAIFDIVNETTRERVPNPVTRVLHEGITIGLANHTVLVARDGTERAIADSGAPIRDASGKVRGVVLVFRDQSEEREAERKIEREQARFRRLLSSGIVGITISDGRGRIVEANDAFLEIVGYTRDEFDRGLVTGAVLDTADRGADDARVRDQLRQHGRVEAWERELVRKDGTRVPVLLGAAMIDEAHECVTFVVDLTERARFGNALRASLARETAVLEAALDAIITMNHEGIITAFNPAAERTFGYAREEVVGRPLGETLVPPGVREMHAAGLEAYLRTGQPHVLGRRIEVFAMRKDGTEFPAEIAVVRIGTDDPPVFTGYVRDITERKQAAEAEMLRRAKEAAEDANTELESFSYSVAHDLRSPLRGLNGFAGALLEDYGERLDDEAKEHIHRIIAGAKRMDAIIDGLLGLSRVTRMEPRRDRVDVTALALEVVADLRAVSPLRFVELGIARDLFAIGDETLIRTLLENLLGNAWKFTSRTPKPKIELRLEEIDGESVFVVRDNGAGFDMAYAAKLFSPFRRLHAAAEFEGNGIGLATVRRIVRRHGGKIWAEGRVGEGTSIFFTLGPNPAKPRSVPR